MRRLLVLALLVPAIGFIPARAPGSVLPSSGTLSWGYTRDLDIHMTAIPSASATWALGSHLAIHSNVAFIRNHYFGRSEFLPLAAGFRFYAGTPAEHTRGLFLDALPAVSLVRIQDGMGGHVFRTPLGVQFGAGFRVPAFDGSRLEVGLNYIHSSSGSSSLTVTRESPPVGIVTPGLNLWALRVGFGWGD